MGCTYTQTANISKVIGSKADYVVPIKGSEENFFDDLKLYFDNKRLEMIIAGNTKSSYKREIENLIHALLYMNTFKQLMLNSIKILKNGKDCILFEW